MDKFAFFVTGHRKLIVLIFLMSTLLSALLLPFLQINYDMKDYLRKIPSPLLHWN